jgi:alanyl-tRNA synthetase
MDTALCSCAASAVLTSNVLRPFFAALPTHMVQLPTHLLVLQIKERCLACLQKNPCTCERRYAAGKVQTTVRAILSESGFVDSTAGAAGPLGVVLERTPFYAESGGQVADTGELAGPSGALFTVHDTKVSTSLQSASVSVAVYDQ